MESIVLSKLDFGSLAEIAAWCNGLVGNYAPGAEQWLVQKVIHFQVVEHLGFYDVLVLVEVSPVVA